MTDDQKKQYEDDFKDCTIKLAKILEECAIPTHVTAVSAEGADHFYLLSIVRFPKMSASVIEKAKSE